MTTWKFLFSKVGLGTLDWMSWQLDSVSSLNSKLFFLLSLLHIPSTRDVLTLDHHNWLSFIIGSCIIIIYIYSNYSSIYLWSLLYYLMPHMHTYYRVTNTCLDFCWVYFVKKYFKRCFVNKVFYKGPKTKLRRSISNRSSC